MRLIPSLWFRHLGLRLSTQTSPWPWEDRSLGLDLLCWEIRRFQERKEHSLAFPCHCRSLLRVFSSSSAPIKVPVKVPSGPAAAETLTGI